MRHLLWLLIFALLLLFLLFGLILLVFTSSRLIQFLLTLVKTVVKELDRALVEII